MLFLFGFWMFQGVVFNHKEVTEKESFNQVFMNYYGEDEGITFQALSEDAYENVPLSIRAVQEKANLYLQEKQVDLENFSFLIDQGIYTNIGLGLSDVIAWRVMFIDETEEILENTEESGQKMEGEQVIPKQAKSNG